MNMKYNVTGSERKAFVEAISEILDQKAIYQGAPDFAYEVDGYIIDKGGTVSSPADATHEDVENLISSLQERGYEAGASQNSDQTLTIEMPKNGFTDESLKNLKKIIASKEVLIKRVLSADSLHVEVSDDKISFPWFSLCGEEGETNAYNQFVSALCQMAKTQKRVTAKEKSVENEKFTMRLFLIRLGFVGDDFKISRKILTRNLTGNSSWKNGPPPKDTIEPEGLEGKVGE